MSRILRISFWRMSRIRAKEKDLKRDRLLSGPIGMISKISVGDIDMRRFVPRDSRETCALSLKLRDSAGGADNPRHAGASSG